MLDESKKRAAVIRKLFGDPVLFLFLISFGYNPSRGPQ
jgi:hypothetical protein